MRETRVGISAGFSAYLIWGSFPFYFTLISIINPFEAVTWRVIATFVFSTLLATFLGKWGQIRRILSNPKTLGWFALSSVFLYINWQIFVIGVMSGHVIETSLGYFINPLVTILIGVVFRREVLTRLQWIAVGVATVGVLAVAIGYGKFPWIAISLALSFGLYGAVHKKVEAGIDGLTGLTVESFVALPIAAVQGVLVWKFLGIHTFDHNAGFVILVFFSGLLTAIPLILFGEAARRLPLSYIGFLQFLTPILSFLYGYFIAAEEMSATRWLGFVGVWIALVILITDMIIQIRRTPAGIEPSLNTEPIPLD